MPIQWNEGYYSIPINANQTHNGKQACNENK